MPRFLSLVLILTICHPVYSQFIQHTKEVFTHADTLRGMLRPERTCIDVKYYMLDIEVLIKEKSIIGSVQMDFEVISDTRKIQLDLYNNMMIDSIICDGKVCKYTREFNAVFVEIPFKTKGTKTSIRSYYHGKPTIAKNAPWDGGFVWSKDKNKRPWIGVACEGAGASLWWPCKDHPSDEPDSVSISITTPDSLACIANGNMTQKIPVDNHRTKYTWKVSYSINLYNVSFYIGDYYLIDNTVYNDFKGRKLDIQYWVLSKKFTVAKLHFKTLPEMLHAYEYYFGPYPFFNDGYALVESPYLGMEHQSAIAYGNTYRRGYLGGRIPDDQNFDYIVVHESAHEYWGNSVSADDHADLWIHESFASYMESLYLEFTQNYGKAVEYLLY
ncbi:MAG TPA: M1 family metallopeptidase, partial [Saprospiraceae bacterium]|nr:M1 family metallopeptidase [Saprospiraceae bacterium]